MERNNNLDDPNINLDDLLDQFIDEELHDNIDEELIWLMIQTYQQQLPNTTRSNQTRRVVHRNREEGHERLFNDYFFENPIYTETQFQRRFHMRRHVFLRVIDAVNNHDEYFRMRLDATRRRGLSPLQKCIAALRMLAYGAPTDFVDEYIQTGETTTVECLQRFVKGICEIFRGEYLRCSNNEDIQRLLRMGEAHGFPRMLGSIDCMHWEWKNYPVAWKGQFYRGDYVNPTIILEVVASQDLWI